MRMLRAAAATVATVGTLACLAGPAQAYDRGNCERAFGAANVYDVDYLKENAGLVDFGDVLHLGGAPQGTAVICWPDNGGVAVVGRVFSDSEGYLGTATAAITYYRDGVAGPPQYHIARGKYAHSTVISEFADGAGSTFTRVKVQLYFDGGLQLTLNRYRGD